MRKEGGENIQDLFRAVKKTRQRSCHEFKPALLQNEVHDQKMMVDAGKETRCDGMLGDSDNQKEMEEFGLNSSLFLA